MISFDEKKEILLHTEEGKLSIKGEGLHVKHLDLKSGQLSLEGKIDSLTYLGRKKDKKEGSLLKDCSINRGFQVSEVQSRKSFKGRCQR